MANNRGAIVGFQGSWGSGLGFLVIDDDKRGRVSIPADNAPTVRALDAAFGGVISEGHTVNNDAIAGKRIVYAMDEMGLTLGGFTPEEEWTGGDDEEEESE